MDAALTLVYNSANMPARMVLRKVCKLRADHAIPHRWDDVRVYFAVRQGLRTWRQRLRTAEGCASDRWQRGGATANHLRQGVRTTTACLVVHRLLAGGELGQRGLLPHPDGAPKEEGPGTLNKHACGGQ